MPSMINFKYSICFVLKETFLFLRKIFFTLLCLSTPIQKNKIVISCFKGQGAGCNPKYITLEILKQNLPYKITWLCKEEFKDTSEQFKDINFVDYNNKIKRIRELASAKIWIDNTQKTEQYGLGLLKKRKQFYINTWHGSLGIKRLTFDKPNYMPSERYLKLLKKDFSDCDLMLSNCKWEEDIYRRCLQFKGKIELIGHPRNDVFHTNTNLYKEKVYKNLTIDKNYKLALYIPTFRHSQNITCFDIDYDILKNSLEKKFGGKWVIAYRYHTFNLKALENKFKFDKQNINATYYPDTQELLTSSDIIVSDYSSCMFDFMLTRRPCFIFASDIEEYNIAQGTYYPLESTPFPIATNNKELEQNILNFNLLDYQKKCDDFLNAREVLEDGQASKRAVKIIKKEMEKV